MAHLSLDMSPSCCLLSLIQCKTRMHHPHVRCANNHMVLQQHGHGSKTKVWRNVDPLVDFLAPLSVVAMDACTMLQPNRGGKSHTTHIKPWRIAVSIRLPCRVPKKRYGKTCRGPSKSNSLLWMDKICQTQIEKDCYIGLRPSQPVRSGFSLEAH